MDKKNTEIGLLHNEQILWQGSPYERRPKHSMTIPAVVMMSIIAVLMIIVAAMGEVKLALVSCMPLLLIGGIFLTYRQYLKSKRKCTVFTITDMRIIRTEGVFVKKISDIRFSRTGEILLKFDKGNKSGTILVRAKARDAALGEPSEIRLFDIKDVTAVYNLAQKQLGAYREK